jgi:hypothetical protein
MIDPSQQQSNSRNSAGYHPLVPQEFAKGLGNSPAVYVAAAVGMGLVLGVAMAFAGGRSHAAAPRVSHALGVHSVYAATTPSLLSQVDTKKKAVTNTPALLRASGNSTSKPAAAHRKHRLHRVWSWKKGGKNGVHRKPYVSPITVDEPDPPTGLERATAAAAAGPFFLGIEGDVTVANYDAGTGAIQTYEGNNFLLAKAGDTSAIPWQDFPFNVHYRCDGTGNCTLAHHGATASARMTR